MYRFDPCCGRCTLRTGTKAVALLSIVIQVGAIILFITSIVLVSQRAGSETDNFYNEQIISNSSINSVRDVVSNPGNEISTTTEETMLDYDSKESPPPKRKRRSVVESNASALSNDADEFISMISDLGTILIVFLGIVVFSVIITHLILAYFLFKCRTLYKVHSQERIIDGCRNWFMVEGLFTMIAFARLLFFILKFGFGLVVLVSIPFHIFDIYSLWIVGAFIQELAQDKGQGIAEAVGLNFTKFDKSSN